MWKTPFICGNLLTFAPNMLKIKVMKRNIVPMLFAAACLLVSCMGSSDDDVTYYNDTAISGFTLGTLYQNVTTKAEDGVTDSTYRVAVTGSKYKFSIDQLNGKIYNTDSLPYGTDLKKVLASVTAKNNGIVFVKSLSSDSITTFSSTDSIDYSQPRQLVVYAYNSEVEQYRIYEVKINVHQEPAGAFFWSKMPKGTVAPEGEAVQGSSKNLYKVEDGLLQKSEDNGATWTVEQIDGDAALLPDANVNFTCKKVKAANDTEYVLLTGTSKADGKNAVNWFKYDGDGENSHWTYIPVSSSNPYALPKLANLSVSRFSDDVLIAIGGKGLDECEEAAYAAVYVSRDNGITWIPNDGFTLPEGLDSKAEKVALTVDGGYVWLTADGQVWRGRLNRQTK